jgi:predicted O-methyltransferase YrrM
MLSGKLQGRFLSLLSRLIKPVNILEIGTYTGYATLCLAEGLQAGGVLHTIEIDAEREEFIRQCIAQSVFAEQIRLHIGNAQTIIPTLQFTWDLVFIDADKQSYQQYYDWVLPQTRKGGLILADNVLWNSKVIRDVENNDLETKSLMTFNNYVTADERVYNLLLPFRDGMMIIEKL